MFNEVPCGRPQHETRRPFAAKKKATPHPTDVGREVRRWVTQRRIPNLLLVPPPPAPSVTWPPPLNPPPPPPQRETRKGRNESTVIQGVGVEKMAVGGQSNRCASITAHNQPVFRAGRFCFRLFFLVVGRFANGRRWLRHVHGQRDTENREPNLT